MKKKVQIIGFAVLILLFLILIIFASTHKYRDSHLRVEGIRVKVNDYALMVEGCNEKTKNAAYCEKEFVINGEEQKLVFEFKNFKESGYPTTIVASINDHEFYRRDDLDFEGRGSIDYQMFANFKVMDDYIVFTFTSGTNGRTTTLYAIDTQGDIVLQEKEIDQNDMLIKDYTDFITYEDHSIRIYATRVIQDIRYKDESICNAPSKDIVEAYYVYTLKNGKFTKKKTEAITAKEFIEKKGITCASKD